MRYFLLLIFCLLSFKVWAVEEVGTEVSDSYFKARAVNNAHLQSRYFFALHMGLFLKDTATRWSDTEESNKGKILLGMTYLLGEWLHIMDMLIRFNYTNYNLPKDSPKQFSLSPLFLIPSTQGRFPLYLGGGFGLGAILSQVKDKSFLALNYHLFAGLRFFEVFGSVGTFVETGYTGHVHLISEGEFKGFYTSIGLLFNF